MRAAAILGLGCSAKDLRPFQADHSIDWRIGVPAAGEVDAVLLFGGDGTIHRHLGTLVRLGLPVLIVPAGSGNDFARALGLKRVRDSLAAWRKFVDGAGKVREVDLGVITPKVPTLRLSSGQASAAQNAAEMGHPIPSIKVPTSRKSSETWGIPDLPIPGEGSRYFCCVAGVGIDAEVARKANRLPRWLRGNGGYALALVPTIFRFAPVPVKLSVGDGAGGWSAPRDEAITLAAFANTPLYGGGMKIAPQARMDDGLLDVCVVGGVDRLKLLALFPTVYGGKHLGIREVQYFNAERVRVETEEPRDIYADGEFVCRTPVEIGVRRGALRVIV